jgi:uncharacterized protein (DUF433 family)
MRATSPKQPVASAPRIVRDQAIRGGAPIIAGTGLRVSDVAMRYELLGMPPGEIVAAFPHIPLAQVHCALSYYYQHKAVFDAQWRDERRHQRQERRRAGSLGERLRARAAILSR